MRDTTRITARRNQEIVLDEKTKRELFTDTFCRVCGAVLQFESHRNAHYEGKRHAQKVRLYFLNKELEEMAYKKKVDHKIEQKAERMNFHVDQQVAQDKNKFCSLCNMVFSSPVVAQSHYIGKIHTKKLKHMSGETSEWASEATDFSLMDPEADVPLVSEEDVDIPSLSEKPNQQEASPEPASADNEIDLSDPNKYCKLCCASFNNPLVAQQHYNGKKHARNELRRKMMEEMEDTGMNVDTGGEGIYVCPICSITLTSIEMYQSHMQGNKHQIKENIVAHIMKTTKKNYDSFENELEDYIKVQKARGLEPKTRIRPDKDQDSAEETEPAPPTHPIPNPAAYTYFGHKAMPPYQAYNPVHKSEHRTAGWDKHYWPQRPTRMPMKMAPTRKHPPSSPESSDSSSSSDDSSGSYKKEKRHKREHRNKERKHHGKSKRGTEISERKKRKIEETDSGKEDNDKKPEELSGDKPKHKKEKKEKPPTEKESKKHKKPKKVEDQRTEEEMLWDESILGF